MKTTNLGFIGGGRITKVFLQAFRNKSLAFDSIVVYEPDRVVASALQTQFPEIKLAGSQREPAEQDLVFLAVHPPVMMETLTGIKEVVDPESIIISLAPKFTIEKIAGNLPTHKIVRMIPNATSYIGKGYNPVCFHTSISGVGKEKLLKIFKKLGKTLEIEEPMLEGYAMISAMLPTYFWFQWKKMEEIAGEMGFDEAEAKKVIYGTLKRSLQLYYKSGLTPEEVMDLIPVKPIGEHEDQIREIYEDKLFGLFDKIRP